MSLANQYSGLSKVLQKHTFILCREQTTLLKYYKYCNTLGRKPKMFLLLSFDK
jgi:hypothetical protein